MPSSDLQQHLIRAERAGQGLAAYARDHDLSVATLYYARSMMRSRPSGFVRVQSAAPAAPQPVAIRLPNGITVSVPVPGSVSDLIAALLPL